MKRAAIYLRVSTDEQTTENQRLVLEGVAARRGWEIAKVYEDAGISGAKGRDKRPGFDAMLKAAARGSFDIVMVWAVDRLGRSAATVSATMEELGQIGVGFYADREGMDATTAHGRALLQLAGVFAELERALFRERVLAGIARARKHGTRIGRPPVKPAMIREIQAGLAAGTGKERLARQLGVGVSTVMRVSKQPIGTEDEAR
jgi:DNA invertase Pin-like site-specific DNA recombinase